MALPNEQTVDWPTYKLVIIGDARTGKTSLLRRHLTGDFTMRYHPTPRVEVHTLEFLTNYGKISFKCVDTAGEVPLGRRKRLPYVSTHCAIIMFSVTNRLTYANVPTWHRDLWRNIPVVLCGNKVDDSTGREVQAKQVKFHRGLKWDMEYVEISAKTSYNIEKPFLYLARKLARDANLYFVESPALYPPEDQIDLVMQNENLSTENKIVFVNEDAFNHFKRHEVDLADAANLPLPDE